MVSCWTQDQTRVAWHGFQSHLGQLIFIENLSLLLSVNTNVSLPVGARYFNTTVPYAVYLFHWTVNTFD